MSTQTSSDYELNSVKRFHEEIFINLLFGTSSETNYLIILQ